MANGKPNDSLAQMGAILQLFGLHPLLVNQESVAEFINPKINKYISEGFWGMGSFFLMFSPVACHTYPLLTHMQTSPFPIVVSRWSQGICQAFIILCINGQL